MTKIKITPAWKHVKPQGNYVYVHTRASTGEPFYVGLGVNKRAWEYSKDKRSDWWRKISIKNGVILTICQDGMSRDDAKLLEMWLIAKFKALGYRICNISLGGDGSIGMRSKNNRTIYTSLGEKFESVTDALIYLRESGIEANGGGANIYACLKGKYKSAYGRAWSYNENPDHPAVTDRERRVQGAINMGPRAWAATSKKVLCSNGDIFPSARAAARYLRASGHPTACQQTVSRACLTEGGTAYGLFWEYAKKVP